MREASPPVIVSPNEDIRVMYYASSTIVWKVEIIFFFFSAVALLVSGRLACFNAVFLFLIPLGKM
jgi:hypothetical protein